MYDGALCYRAKRITTFLTNKSGCSQLARKFWKTEVTMKAPSTKQELIEIHNTWKHNPEIKLKTQNCVSSMPRRITALLAAKSGRTKY